MVARLVRRKWFLALMLLSSLMYFIYKIHKKMSSSTVAYPLMSDALEVAPPQKMDVKHLLEIRNDTQVKASCRNSVQGWNLIVDDRGYVCERQHLLKNGCCGEGASTQYVCSSCARNQCCQMYEHCVSCCLRPSQRAAIESIISRSPDSLVRLFASARDVFDFCLAKCRTSSQSVQHENSYRDARSKHCYGLGLPGAPPPDT